MIVKAKRSGLTIVEMLVVVAIISLLVGMLLPAVNKVKSMAREAKQKVQFTAIDLGLATFKNDYGDYPPSDQYTRLEDTGATENTSGAQKLAEALLGWDLLGFHPDSGWRIDGMNRWDYSDGTTTQAAGSYWLYDRTFGREMDKRKDRYIDIDTANVARLGNNASHDGLFDLTAFGAWSDGADTFVLCDVFGKGKEIVLDDGTRKKSGLPILYYRADVEAESDGPRPIRYDEVYDRSDNADDGSGAFWAPSPDDWRKLIRNPDSPQEAPYRPRSYLLIAPGRDRTFGYVDGTTDDLANFKRKN